MISLDTKLTLWLMLGIPLSVGWLLLVAVLVRPRTGRAFAWWVLPMVAVGVVAPLLWKIALWLLDILEPAVAFGLSYWWAPLLTLAVVAVAVGGWLLYRWERGPVPVDPPAAEAPPEPAQPVQMWSLPTNAHQWDTDSLPR